MKRGARKTAVISIRVTDEERDVLLVEAKALGLSVSELLRRATAAEVAILREQRAIRDRARMLRLMPHGTTHGAASMANHLSVEGTEDGLRYVYS